MSEESRDYYPLLFFIVGIFLIYIFVSNHNLREDMETEVQVLRYRVAELEKKDWQWIPIELSNLSGDVDTYYIPIRDRDSTMVIIDEVK